MKTFAKKTKRPIHPVHRTRAAVPPFFNPAAQAQRAQVRQVLRAPQVQAKLTIGQPNDKYEQEADRVADEVMRMPESEVQRVCTYGGGESKCQAQQLDTRYVQSKNAGESVVLSVENEVLRSPYHPLEASTKAFFQSRFGHDLSPVRIHTNARSAHIAKELNARAFTFGKDIFFAAGEWSPTTDRGRWLIAHELAHTMQYDRGHVVYRKTSIPKKPTSISTKKDLHVFVYDMGDKALSPIWKATAKAFAKSQDGIAVQSGANATATLGNIVQALNKNRTKYGCIRSIEFFGHGTAGVTLVGKGAIKEADIPAAASKATALTGSHSGPTVTLHNNFARLRGALCSSSYLHFRSCETFKGPQGAKFASHLAKYLGKSYLIGHTKVIDINLPGREVYDPTGKKMKPTAKMPAGLLPAKQPASKLPVQNFHIEIDLSGLGKGKTKKLPSLARFFLVGRNTISLSAQVLDYSDPEQYLLRALLLAPPLITLGSLAKVIPTLVPPGTVAGPTVRLIKAKGHALDVPIDRRLVERIARLRVLTFTYPTPYGTVKIKITGASKGPGVITRAGGFELSAGAIYSPAFAKSVLGIANIQLPLTSFGPSVKGVPVNVFRLHTGADVLFGDKTAIGRLNLGMRFDLETLRVDLGIFGGGGLYQGRPDWMVGGGAGLGTKIGNITVDAGWQMFFTGQGGKEPNHAFFLRLGWRFE